MRIKGKIIFVLIMAALQVLCYFAFTVSGFMRIYNYVLERSLYRAGDARGDEEHLSELYGDCRGDVLFLNKKVEGNSINFDQLWMNINYLRRFYQVRYIVIDCGYAEGSLLNDYMDSDNTSAIGRVVAGLESDELRSSDFIELIGKITELNKELPESSKIRFVGVAPETNASIVKRYLKKILSRSSGRSPAEEIKSSVEQGTRTDSRYIQNLARSIDKYPNLYRQLLIENFYEFRYTVTCYDPEPDAVRLQKTSAENFAGFLDRNNKAKCIIQYSDPSLISEIYSLRPDLKNRSAAYEVRYMNCHGSRRGSPMTLTVAPEAMISDGEQRIVFWNDQYLKWLENYRKFVYKINNREAGRYVIDEEGSGLFMLMCDSKPIEEYVLPPDEFISK